MSLTQAQREVSVTTAAGADVLLFAGMHGVEELGRLSEFTVRLESLDRDVRIADVLGKSLNITLATMGEEKRHFDGVVTRFRSTGVNGNFATYEATVHPALWLLTRASNCRVFQNKDVVAIVKEVCGAYGNQLSLTVALSGTYSPLPYCVQYRETDFNFVCRLLEEAGIYFYFTHTASTHAMVLADVQGGHQPIPGYNALAFQGAAPMGADAPEGVLTWSTGGAITAGSYVVNDVDFEAPATKPLGTASIAPAFGQGTYEVYDYPGNYKKAGEGDLLARARLESLHGQGERIVATTTARGLYPGGIFTLAEHPREESNRGYLVTSTQFDVTGNDYASGERAFSFSCRIEAIGQDHAYLPLPVCRKPVLQGPQTAIVTGPAGEEIHTDQYGRIKVIFFWDRDGKADDTSSCWVRVAQGWAGQGWGAMALPRVGMEVVVSFLEGNPDRPLVTGCVYNAANMPPYTLPDEKTVSTVKSQSSKGGEGFNELRFEDAKGEEEIYLHAERDFLRVVKNNDALKVGFETADKGDQTVDIKHDQTITIGHDALETITNNQTLKVHADQDVGIDGSQNVKVGTTIVIEAGTSIELKVGGSSIRIEAGKITIKAPEIEVAADANAKVKAGAMMDIQSGAVMTIGGALVQIN